MNVVVDGLDKYPDLSEKIFVSGAIGYDKYQFKKPNKISDIITKNILALLGSLSQHRNEEAGIISKNGFIITTGLIIVKNK